MNPACIGLVLEANEEHSTKSSEENCYFKLINLDSMKHRTFRDAGICLALLVILCLY